MIVPFLVLSSGAHDCAFCGATFCAHDCAFLVPNFVLMTHDCFFVTLNFVLMVVLLLVLEVAIDLIRWAFKSWCSFRPVRYMRNLCLTVSGGGSI